MVCWGVIARMGFVVRRVVLGNLSVRMDGFHCENGECEDYEEEYGNKSTC